MLSEDPPMSMRFCVRILVVLALHCGILHWNVSVPDLDATFEFSG